jgi:hypothetical protein
MEACSRQLWILKAKSLMVPVNTCEEKLTHLARIFNYEARKLPFTYLGLPFSLTKNKVIDLKALVN